VSIAFATLMAGGLELMAWWQTRWHMTRAPRRFRSPSCWWRIGPRSGRLRVRAAVAAAVVAVLYAPGGFIGYSEIPYHLARHTVRLADRAWC
jgi:hypothetical protein